MKTSFRFAMLRSYALACVIVACFAVAIFAQAKPFNIAYDLTISNPASHLFEVKMTINTPSPVASFDVQMPRWSPGRYAVVDFAKGVQEVLVAGPASISRVDTQTWRVVPNKQKTIVITYKVFANNLSGTFSQLNERHANYNGGTIYMYIVDHKQDSVSLKINAPTGWKIANGRMTSPDQTEWKFDNYDILIDTPTEMGTDFSVDEFRVDAKLYRVIIHSFGKEGNKKAQFVKDVEKIVRAETAMMGPPEFDSYMFLFHFAPGNEMGSDGMEHLTSTQIIATDTLAAGGYDDALDTAAHEFFHVWNVKRLRPVELGPWDFTKPLATRGLFIAEGFTNYYGKMMLERSGLWADKDLISSYGRTIEAIENSPGAKLISAEESSLIAPFLDRASRVQATNMGATTFSYYPKGELIALTLDLMIRKRTNGRKSLDDVMRKMYDEFYLKSPKATYYLRGRGYTVEDWERVTTQVAGVNMSDFFAKYIHGVETPPYDEGLNFVGLQLVSAATKNGTPNTNLTGYSIAEMPNASAEALARRKDWLSGKTIN